MKKKFGVNITLFVIIIGLTQFFSCINSKNEAKEQELLDTDRKFSEISVKEGMFKAFVNFIADDGVILRDEEYPSKGKETLSKRYEGKSDTAFTLSWEPLYASIAGSGDLGYTYGIHKTTVKATGAVEKGTYVTIWRRQTDGSWKFVLDTGTSGLPVEGK